MIHKQCYICNEVTHRANLRKWREGRKRMKPIDEKIREVLDTLRGASWLCGKENRYNIASDVDQALSAILSLVRGELPEKKVKNWDDDKLCRGCNRGKEWCQCDGFNQALTDLHKKFGGEK